MVFKCWNNQVQIILKYALKVLRVKRELKIRMYYLVLSRNTKEHLEKDSKELSYISNMNFELQNSVDWLNNR